MTIAVEAAVEPSIPLEEDRTEDLPPEKDTIVTENSVTNTVVVETVEHSVPEDLDPANEPEINLGTDCTPKSSPTNYPQAFYCHRTNVLMKDPVVGTDGESMERSATHDSTSTKNNKNKNKNKSPYYPNRALKAIIQESMVWNEDSLRSSWLQIQHSVSHSLSQILPDAATEGIFRPLNDAFYCPITFNLMHHPVIDPEGYTFERVAVENWIRINGNSPITRATLSIDQLYENKAISRLLQEEKEKPDHQMHPSILKWKDERAPLPTDIEVGGGALLEQQQRRQRVEPNTTLVFITSSNGRGPLAYPMTPREWNDRELSRRQTLFTMFAMLLAASCLATFIIIAFVNFGGTLYLMLFALALLVVLSKRRQ